MQAFHRKSIKFRWINTASVLNKGLVLCWPQNRLTEWQNTGHGEVLCEFLSGKAPWESDVQIVCLSRVGNTCPRRGDKQRTFDCNTFTSTLVRGLSSTQRLRTQGHWNMSRSQKYTSERPSQSALISLAVISQRSWLPQWWCWELWRESENVIIWLLFSKTVPLPRK